jgi:GNAT superfamily N-acetyltransferase
MLSWAALLVAGAVAVVSSGGGSPWGPVLFVRSHEIIMGQPGCGKTPWAVARVRGARRVLFFDSAGDFAKFAECGEVIPAELLTVEALRGRFRRVCVAVERDELGEQFKRVLEICSEAAEQGGLVFVVDEVGDLKRDCEVELLWLHRAGHKKGIASVLLSACVNDFPKRCRDTASAVHAFYVKAAEDAVQLNREYGDEFGDRARAWRHPAPPVSWVNPVLHDHHITTRRTA